MNICMLVYSHYSRDARVRRYAESLARKGYNIDIISLKENYKPQERNIRLIMYPFPRYRLGKLWYFIEYFLFFIFSFLILNSLFVIRKYKLIHVHNMPDVLVFAAVVPKIFRSKVILDLHDPMPELYMSKYHVQERNLIVKSLKYLEKKSMHFSDIILTANPFFKRIFIKRNPEINNKIHIILNCPDPKIFHTQPITYNLQHSTCNLQNFDFAQGKSAALQLRSGKAHNLQELNLMYMGTIDERFNLSLVIDAVNLLKEKIPHLRFVIIPKIEQEGRYFQALKQKILYYKLKNLVIIKRPLPLEIIAKELRHADVGIVLAKKGRFTESIMPVKLLEFIAMGVPVIATRTKILSDYFTDKMLYFLKENTPKELSNALFTLYKNKKQRQKYARNAKNFLSKYNWQKEEAKYLALFNKFLA